VQVAFSVTEPGDFLFVVNIKGIINGRAKCTTVSCVNHVGKTKDVSTMGWVKAKGSIARGVRLSAWVSSSVILALICILIFWVAERI